jgi:transposase InsO family protein
LSGNGSAYIAKNTLDTATALGLNLCFTPVHSPESNGIAEAFVKTFKRDYARLSILPDAATVIMLLPAWFEGYSDVHPHSGLKFLSPENFFASVLSATKLPVRSSRVHTIWCTRKGRPCKKRELFLQPSPATISMWVSEPW